MKVQTKPFSVKVIYTVIAVMLLLLGLVGLIVPVIPGVVFLVLAVLLLGQVSSRVNQWVEKQPVIRQAGYRMRIMGELQWIDRLRLAGWITVQTVIKGTGSLWRRISNSARRQL